MTNPFRITCDLCNREDDIRKMKMFKGKYYHTKKVSGFQVTCFKTVQNQYKKR